MKKHCLFHMSVISFCALSFLLLQHGSSWAQTVASGPIDEKCVEARKVFAAGIKLDDMNLRREAFQKAVDLCPTYAEAHGNLANAYERLAMVAKLNFDGAREANDLLDLAVLHYEKALKIRPGFLGARNGLANLLMTQGRYPLALQHYMIILKEKPDMKEIEKLANEARKRSDKNTGQLKKAAEISGEARKSDMQDVFRLMGFQSHVIRDSDRQSFNNILFDGWSSAIRPGEPLNQLNEIGKALSSPELFSYKFIIEGHANAVGDYGRNMELSNDRANAVREYLVRNFNINPNRLLTQGFGFTRPKTSPETDPVNRRVEIVFFKENSAP